MDSSQNAETAEDLIASLLVKDSDAFDYVVDITTTVAANDKNRFHLREAMSCVHKKLDHRLLKRKKLPKPDNKHRSRFLFFIEGMDKTHTDPRDLHLHGLVGFSKKPTRFEFWCFKEDILKELLKRNLLRQSRTDVIKAVPVSKIHSIPKKFGYQIKHYGKDESMHEPIVFGSFKTRSIFE